MNLKMRFTLAKRTEAKLDASSKYLPNDTPDFLRMMGAVDVTSRKSDEENSFYWDLIPKKLRATMEALKIAVPPRFIT